MDNVLHLLAMTIFLLLGMVTGWVANNFIRSCLRHQQWGQATFATIGMVLTWLILALALTHYTNTP
jgi:uncharacterized membrane protein YcjF (UPF0283 family)